MLQLKKFLKPDNRISMFSFPKNIEVKTENLNETRKSKCSQQFFTSNVIKTQVSN